MSNYIINAILISTALYHWTSAQDPPKLSHRRFNTEYSVPEDTISFYQQYNYGNLIRQTNDAFPFAVCRTTDADLTYCNVTLDLKKESQDQCKDVQIRGKDASGPMIFDMNNMVMPFASNRVLLMWNEHPHKEEYLFNFAISIVHTQKCTSKYLSFPVTSKTYQLFWNPLVVYQESLEFFAEDTELCSNVTSKNISPRKLLMCRIMYDQNGEQIGDLVPFSLSYKSVSYLRPISSLSGDKGFMTSIVDRNTWQMVVVELKPTGKKRAELMREVVLDSGYPRLIRTSWSDTNDCFALCWWLDEAITTISCRQFWYNGTRTNLTANFDKPQNAASVHSYTNGDLLVVTLTGTKGFWTNTVTYQNFTITTIPESGVLDGVYEFQEPALECHDSPAGLTITFAENNQTKELCIYFYCSKNLFVEIGEKRKWQFAGHCIKNPNLNSSDSKLLE